MTLDPSSCISLIPCFMAPPPDLLFDYTYKIPWDDTSNTPCLTGIPTYVYLVTKIDSLLTNQGALVAQVTE